MSRTNTEARKAAVRKYDAANTRQYHLKLNLKTDADIIARFDKVDSIQGYIKALVRDDIAWGERKTFDFLPDIEGCEADADHDQIS